MNYVLLAALLSVAIYFIWTINDGYQSKGLVVAVTMFVMVYVVERMLNTSYTVTDSEIIVHRGRLNKDFAISISAISSVSVAHRFSILEGIFSPKVCINMADGTRYFLSPQSNVDFIKHLERIINS